MKTVRGNIDLTWCSGIFSLLKLWKVQHIERKPQYKQEALYKAERYFDLFVSLWWKNNIQKGQEEVKYSTDCTGRFLPGDTCLYVKHRDPADQTRQADPELTAGIICMYPIWPQNALGSPQEELEDVAQGGRISGVPCLACCHRDPIDNGWMLLCTPNWNPTANNRWLSHSCERGGGDVFTSGNSAEFG